MKQKGPSNTLIVVILIAGIVVGTALFILGRPKNFVLAKSNGDSNIICNCLGRVSTEETGREVCRGIVFSCNKNE